MFHTWQYWVSESLRYLTVDRSVRVREQTWPITVCISHPWLCWLFIWKICIGWLNWTWTYFSKQDFSKPLSRLQKLIVLYILNTSGHWYQLFERALSWDMVTWCDLSRQKFNTNKWVWFQSPSHTSLPEYRDNKKSSETCLLFIWSLQEDIHRIDIFIY